jgi:hypothetical protein
VIHAQYLNDISLQPIGDNEGRLGDEQLARDRDGLSDNDHRVIGGLLERLPRIPMGIVDLDQSQ